MSDNKFNLIALPGLLALLVGSVMYHSASVQLNQAKRAKIEADLTMMLANDKGSNAVAYVDQLQITTNESGDLVCGVCAGNVKVEEIATINHVKRESIVITEEWSDNDNRLCAQFAPGLAAKTSCFQRVTLTGLKLPSTVKTNAGAIFFADRFSQDLTGKIVLEIPMD